MPQQSTVLTMAHMAIWLDLDGNSNPPKDATAQDPAKIVVHHGTSIFVNIFCLFYLFQGSFVAYLDDPT